MSDIYNVEGSKKGLDKKGKGILVFTLLLSALFFVLAFTVGGATRISLYQNKYISADMYDHIDVKFTAEESGYYYLTCDNANIWSAGFSYEKLSRTNNYSSSYDDEERVYKIWCDSDTTYTFEIYVTSYSGVELYISRDCPYGYNDN